MAEDVVFLLQLLITGVAVGSVYALMALGFVLIFKASSVVNFGPGELVLFGAYVSWATTLQMQFPLYIAFPLTLVRFGVDPAVAAGPFLTTTTDVLGFFVFLGLETLFLV